MWMKTRAAGWARPLGVAGSVALHGTLILTLARVASPVVAPRADTPVAVTVAFLPGPAAPTLYQPGGHGARAQPIAARPAVKRPRAGAPARARTNEAGPKVSAPAAAAPGPAARGTSGGSGVGPGAAGAGDAGALARARYLATVLRPIIAHTVYPEEAERIGLEGAFVVRIAIDGKGRLVEAHLVGATPHSLLRNSAFAALAASQPLPAPPAELGPVVEVDVPFVYRLDG